MADLRHDPDKVIKSLKTRKGAYLVPRFNVELFLEDLGRLTLPVLDTIGTFVQTELLGCCAEASVHLVPQILGIVVDRYFCNDNGEALAPVLSHDLVSSDMRPLMASTEQLQVHLNPRFSNEELERINEQLDVLYRL